MAYDAGSGSRAPVETQAMKVEVPVSIQTTFENIKMENRVFSAAILRNGQWHVARWFPSMQCFVVGTISSAITTFPDAERIILLS